MGRPTREQILEVLDYDSERGILIWKVSRGSTVKPGDIAGTETFYGSIQMSLLGRRVQVSHVIWFLETGQWPTRIVDHEDRCPSNNRFGNLRHVTSEVNILHEIHKNSEEGVYEISAGKFAVVIRKSELSVCVGSYRTKKQAFDTLEACRKIR